MFKRVLYENWHTIVPILAFAGTALFYGVMVLRGTLMQKEKANHLAHLPLDD